MANNPLYNPQPGKEYNWLKTILEDAVKEGEQWREFQFGAEPESEPEGEVIDLQEGEGYTVLPGGKTPSAESKPKGLFGSLFHRR